MSFARLFHWTCDICGVQHTKEGYGFPKGFIYYFNQGRVEHACPTCVVNHKLKEKDEFNPS